MTVKTITPGEVHEFCQHGEPVDLIDVRTPVEFRQVHALPARNVPLDLLDPRALVESRSGCADAPIYLICRSGGRSMQACEKFLAAGLTNVVNVDGGTMAWEEVGLPVVRGKKAISLERQVRIAAGLLVLLGAALSLLVHPYWVAIAAVVGAGLIHAGVTDTCGMGMLLAKMPWNRVDCGQSACCASQR